MVGGQLNFLADVYPGRGSLLDFTFSLLGVLLGGLLGGTLDFTFLLRDTATMGFIVGFIIMMILDVSLG